MKVELKPTTAAKGIMITDEYAASSYGIPVAVVDGEAYGPADELPIWPENDELAFLHESAGQTVAAAAAIAKLTDEERDFVRRFFL